MIRGRLPARPYLGVGTGLRIWRSPAEIRDRELGIGRRRTARDRSRLEGLFDSFGPILHVDAGTAGPEPIASPRAVGKGSFSIAQKGSAPGPAGAVAPLRRPRQPTWFVNDGQNPAFEDVLAHTRKIEGGFANRPKTHDTGGPTQKGISQKFLNMFNRKYPHWNLPKQSRILTDEQIDGIYRFEFFDRPKLDKVASIKGIDQRLVRQLFDAGAQHGSENAGQWLQMALDKHIGTDLRVTDKNGARTYDGNIGPATRKALETAIRTGKWIEVNNEIAAARLAYMKTLPNYSANPGWIPRANSFGIKP